MGAAPTFRGVSWYEGRFLPESKDRATGFGKPRFHVTAWNIPLLPGKYMFQ
jgi:hypothetical protein